jgi:hypothetical protein
LAINLFVSSIFSSLWVVSTIGAQGTPLTSLYKDMYLAALVLQLKSCAIACRCNLRHDAGGWRHFPRFVSFFCLHAASIPVRQHNLLFAHSSQP